MRRGTSPRTPRPLAACLAALGLTTAALAAAAPVAAAADADGSGAGGAPGGREHVVAAGDTAWALARSSGTTVEAIAAANGLADARRLSVGQRLLLPPAAGDAAAGGAPGDGDGDGDGGARRHAVVAGDTVDGLARAAGTTTAELARANGLADPRRIRVGQVLLLPAGGAEGGAAQAAPEGAAVADSFAGRRYPPRTTASATAHRDALRAADLPDRAAVRELVRASAQQQGVDPSLALAVAHQESGFDPAAVSPADAVGAMQVIPATADWASARLGRDLDPLDPADNADAGVALLDHLLASTPDEDTALAGYYQGLAGVRRDGQAPDTRAYVAAVQAQRDDFR